MFKVSRENVRLGVAAGARDEEWEFCGAPPGEASGAGRGGDCDADAAADTGDGESAAEEDAEEIAKERAEAIIARAESEAEEILARANERAEELRRSAYSEGFLEGHVEGDRKAAAEYEAVAAENRAAIERVISEFLTSRDAKFKEFETLKSQIRDLVLEIVKKIINLSYENDDNFLGGVIENALERIKPDGKLTVNVSEADYERFFPSGSAEFRVNGSAADAVIVKNPSLGRMEIIVDSGDVTVNVGPETQLRRIGVALEKSGAL